jgi:XTP/dITP diphosphohydrolase
MLVSKLLYRASKSKYKLPIAEPVKLPDGIDQDQFGELLLGLISQAVEKGLDPEAALRGAAKSLITQIKTHETR